MTNTDRIRTEYARRLVAAWGDPWSPRNQTGIYYRQQIERNLIAVMNKAGVGFHSNVDILDVGCGGGPHLRYFVELGAAWDRLHGIDLVPERVEIARQLTPGADIQVADATSLPYDDAAFEVVSQFTALCNLHDPASLEQAAREMARVLKPSGHILWVDIMRPAEAAAPYQAIPEQRVRELFPGFRVVAARHVFHRWTMMLAGRFPDVALAVERLPVGKSHLVAVLRRATPRAVLA